MKNQIWLRNLDAFLLGDRITKKHYDELVTMMDNKEEV